MFQRVLGLIEKIAGSVLIVSILAFFGTMIVDWALFDPKDLPFVQSIPMIAAASFATYFLSIALQRGGLRRIADLLRDTFGSSDPA